MTQDLDLGLIQARAKVLAAEDRSMRRALVELRRKAGLTQQDVANFMGCTQQAVQKLERYDADPQLSTLRRYANAVGAIVRHVVQEDSTGNLTKNGLQAKGHTSYVLSVYDGHGVQSRSVDFPANDLELLSFERAEKNSWDRLSASMVVNRTREYAGV